MPFAPKHKNPELAVTNLTTHPKYRAANEGDRIAAVEMVFPLMKPERIPWKCNEIFTVSQIDRDYRNAIPGACAPLLAKTFGAL